MLKSRMGLVVLSVVALAMAPTFAAAATMGAEVFGAYNTFSMKDVNDALPSDADELSSGLTGGLGVRMWTNPNWMLSARWEPLFLETKSNSMNTTLNMDASSFQFSASYFFPSTTNARYGIGAGIGHYSVSGEGTDASVPPTVTTAVEGSGPGFHIMGSGEWTVSPGFAFTAGAGFRFAEIEIQNSTTKADYSGFMARAGLAFYLPSQK